MKKKFTILITAAFMLLAMIVQPVRVCGQTRDDQTATWTASSGALGSGIGSGTITDNGDHEWSYTRTLKSGTSYTGWTSNCIQLGKNGGVENLTLTTSAIPGTIKSVSVECASYQGKHNVSITVGESTYLASTATTSWTTVGTKTGTGTSSGTITISFTGGTRAMYIKSITVIYNNDGGSSVAAPTFSLASGTYPGTQSVEISCATDNSTIYYTLDGTAPDNNSTEYTSAISVSETKTIKAIAYVGEETSSVATATYTILTPLTTMQAIFDAATGSETQVAITFDNWVISGGTAYQAYLTDGTNGCVIYGSGHGFAAGNVLSGSVVCKLVKYIGQAELKELTTATSGISVTTGGSITSITTTIDALTAVNTGSVITLNHLTYSSSTSSFKDASNNEIKPYSSAGYYGYSSLLEDGKIYNITGIYSYGNTTTEKRINPRSEADIVEYVGPSLAINPTTAEAFTYVHNAGPSADQEFVVTGSNLTSEDITAEISDGASYFELTKASEYGSSATIASGDKIYVRMKASLAKGAYEGELTLSTAGASDVVVALSGSVTGAPLTVTYYANGPVADPQVANCHEGDNVTVINNPFSYTGYAFTTWNTAENGSGFPYAEGATIENISANMSLYAQWEEVSEVVDVLNRAFTGITGNTYTSWSGKTGTSGAVYAGKSAGGNDAIQLRTTNEDEGIVVTSTVDGGKVKKVVVSWNSNTQGGRTLNIYGKNTAYSAASDLYNSTDQGTLLGTIVKGTSTELNITGDYAYIGLRSNSSAMFLDEIQITWSTTPSSDPSISAENVSIGYDETEGSIAYTLNNPVTGGELTVSVPDGSWLTKGAVTESSVAFTCSVNPATAARTETVTFTYTYGNSKTTYEKEVTVTQAGNPDVADNISDITELNHNYHVKGQVVATNARGFVIGDGTGYVYTYMGNTSFSHGVGAKLSISGSTGTYGQILQFTNTATIETVTETNYDGTPAVTVITEVPDYSEGYHLSTYLQFEGNLTKTGDYYYVAVGEGSICMSYPTTDQGTTLTGLLSKTVRVKGYFAGISGTTGFTVMIESVEEVTNPTISIDPATAQPFTYIENAGPSDEQMFEVSGTNLTSDDIVATITTGADYFEITDNETYSSSVTVNSGDYISIRMRAGLAKGPYEGTLTLSTEGASNVEVALNGNVTGQTYAIIIDNEITGGTIESDLTTAEEGATVTLTATPDAAYNFSAWMVLKDDQTTEITVTDNQFTMPACQVYVTAEFTAKPTNAITCVANPTIGGEIEASPASAYEGQTVTLSYLAETGYTFSEIVITKTSDGSTTGITPTASGDDYTFTMPGYAVTATATFISDTYYGSFMKFTGSVMEEGDYILVYNDKAMNNDNTTTSSKLGATDVNTSTTIITNPSRSIVWHIAPIGTDGKWTIYNVVVNQYVNAARSDNTNLTLVDNASWSGGAKWSVTIDENDNTYDFSSLTTSRALRYYESSDVFGHYATSNGGPFTLYKYTVLTERTITFNGNGGTYNEGDTYTQTVYDGIAANLDANKFTKEGSAFIGWSTTTNGEVEYADGASITVNDDLTLYAQWATSYTAMVDDQIVGGTVKVNDEDIVEVAAGTEMTLTYTANPGYAFSEWNVYKEGDETTTVEVTENSFTMPAYDVIVSATFVEVTTYSLVTNVNQIVSGKHYIIASGTNGSVKVMAGQNSNNRASVVVTATEGVIPETDGIYEFVINGPFTFNEKDCYTIYDKNASSTGYLYAASSSSNYLRTKAELDANGKWNIEIDGNSHKATVKAQGNYTRNWMRNNGSLFSCYASDQSDIYLYVKDNDHNLEYYGSDITISDETLASNSVVVGNGSVVTFNGTNDNPDKLIIEDGGQLIHDNPVSATIQRNITGYGRSNPSGYQFIASPVKDDLNVDETNLTTSGSYDLYIFDQSQPSKEWRNYKANGFTTIGNGVGYLYANTTNITISFSGELKPSDNDVPVTLAYTDGNRCAGWNLIGNPFACKAYIKGATDDIEAFYRMNGNGDGYDAVVGAINPMEGIFVQANDIDQYFYFTRTAPVATPGKGNLNLEIAQVVTNRDARQATDNAIIRFDGGNALEKFSFSEDNAKLYIPQNGKDYAVVSADAQGELPVYFKAAENGTYTISFSMDNVEFGYLHLIDNKNGNDVDLLQTPSYTFEASTIDYASRFRLVFRAIGNDNDSENNDFGFFDANGNLLILGIEGTATLQVMDVMGRVISSETFSGDYSKTINAKAGVYMLRLIQGSNVRTQKIVVR